MAKKTKNSNLSIEERLEQALIPNWDEPYKLPENWCWTTIKQVAEIVTGGTPSKKNPEYYGESFPFFKPADLDAGRSVRVASEYLSEKGKAVARIIPAKSTAVCCIGSIGKSGYLEVDGTTNQQINSAIPKINPLYLYYYVNTDFFTNQLWQKSSATTISIVNKSKMEECTFPLCPTDEQQRIVDRIETLFAKLDEAKEKAQDVLDGFETRKAAILHKAFSGKLTAKWKLAHSEICEIWKQKKFSMITHNFDSQRIPLSQEERNNLARTYDYYGASGIIDKVDQFLFEGRKLLIGEDGANLITRSKPIAFIADGQYWVNNHAHVITTTSEMLLDFLCYYINSIDLTPYVTGSAQPKMTQAKMNSIPVPVPSIQEQTEIVRLLDDIICKEQYAKEAAEAVIEQIDTMKKAILARAFRGELGTNDPSEENAVELLKRVLSGGEN